MVLSLGCDGTRSERVASSVQEIRAGAGDDGNVMLSVDVLVTDDGGAGLPCTEGVVEVEVEISRNGLDGPWVLVDSDSIESTCVAAGGNLALVVDNSGSLEENLETVQEGARRAVGRVLDDGGQVSLTRVSTNARVLTGLGDDQPGLDQAVDGLFVNQGWTALWDGVRMGNETLGAAANQTPLKSYSTEDEFCSESSKNGILLFTDGQENNSQNQKLESPDYPGDGIDTTLDDLGGLSVAGARTPIYAIGLGPDVDAEALQGLADDTGGRFLPLDDISDVDDALQMVSQYFSSARRVCTKVPSHLCGALDVRVTHRVKLETGTTEETSLHHIDLPCDARARGRVATILLTMNATETTEETMMTLVANTVNWVSPVDAPRVLFVLDDSHHGEFDQDTHQIYEKLVAAGYKAEYLEEPEVGITNDDVAGFDVVWFSNPGYPIDDQQSFDVLLQFSQAGGGVVFQGDDMSWSFGQAFPTTPLTRLKHIDNGTQYCGVQIDNGTGGRYRVELREETHPIIAGLEGQSFLYGDDIDTADPVTEATEVLAFATVEGVDGCALKPVITAYTPP